MAGDQRYVRWQDDAMRTGCYLPLRSHQDASIAAVSHQSTTTAAPVPQVGQMAPNMKADLVR